MKPKKLPVKVISVGNISLGGTGKTPAIIFFAIHLIKSGKKVGIVSRGYGGKNKDIKVLINADNNSKIEDYGDEPILLSSRLRNIPIAVGANKYNHYTARNVRRLIPFQNVWYLDWLFDDIEKGLR